MSGGRDGKREGARRTGGLKQKAGSGYLRSSWSSCGSFMKCPDEAPAFTRLPHGAQRHLEKGGVAGPE